MFNIFNFLDYSFVNGGVLHNSRFAWLANGAKFIVINVVTGNKIAAWTFGAILRYVIK